MCLSATLGPFPTSPPSYHFLPLSNYLSIPGVTGLIFCRRVFGVSSRDKPLHHRAKLSLPQGPLARRQVPQYYLDPLLGGIMRGVRRASPAPPDTCAGFLLPLYLPLPFYLHPPWGHWLIFKAAVALGFHAMLCFGAFCQLTPNHLTHILRIRFSIVANTPTM